METRRIALLSLALAALVFGAVPPAAGLSEVERLWLVGSKAFDDQIYGLAERALERFVRDYPDEPRTPAAVLLRAKTRLALGLLDRALDDFRRAQRFPIPPGEPGEAPFWEGEILYRLKRYAEAQAAYESALRELSSPLVPDALYGLGLASLQQNQPERAVRAFQRLLAGWASHPRAAAVVYHLARTLADLKRPDEVRSLLASYETTYPDSPWLVDALYLRGWSQLTTSQPEGASASLQAFLERAPDNDLVPQARLYLAEALFRQGKKADGLRQLHTLVEASPGTAPILYETGLLARRFDSPADAERAWRRIQAEFPGHRLAHRASLELARAAFTRKRYADALAASQAAAASAEPEVRLEARLLSGESLLQLKRDGAALQEFKAAVEASPANHPLRWRAVAGLGLAHERLQHWAEAGRLYELVASGHDETLKEWAAERLKAMKAQQERSGSGKPPNEARERPPASKPGRPR